MTPEPTPTKWLSLAEASEWLGVHPTTLRRWADAGQIPVMLTPGGHRRFAYDDLERFAATHRLHPSAAIEQRWSAEALQHTRERLSQATAPWLQSVDEQQREAQRTLGRRLMAVIVRYAEEQSEETLAEAQAIGYEYAANLQRGGLSITAALEAFLFFRDAMMEAALQMPDLAAQRHESNAGLVRRMNMVFNTVQLAMIDRYTHPPENP